MKRGKRGLSTIVVTLIIILVFLVAVGIIWIVVRNVIQRGAEGISMGQFTLDAKIKNVNLENSSNNVNLTVKRNPGEGQFNGLKFIFYDGRNSEVITQVVSLNELEERRFNFHLNIVNVSRLVSISIVPILNQNGKESIGNVLDKYMIAGHEQYQFVCTPATCSGLGYTCGTWNNGTCSGNLNCGTCSGGYTCNSSGRCVSGSCTPTTCVALGYECNIWGNGTCSGNLNCGNCSSYGTGYTCNATGRCVSGGDSSLVAYYPFNGNANDESGNGHNGVLVNNPVFVIGKIGQGLKFNGIQSTSGMYVTVPDSNSLEGFTALTLCAWVNATSIYATDANVIIAKTMQTAGASASDPFSLYAFGLTPTGNYDFAISTGISGSRRTVTSASTVSLNTWHHLCATYNGTTMSLYKDGIKDTNTVLTNLVIGSNSIDLRIGAFMAALPYTDVFNGTIDEVRIYNRSLSQAEITSLAGVVSVQCNDGVDNDGNGCADYPADTGCSSASDTTESGGTCLDVTPPTRSNGAPSGTLLNGTTQTTISLNTNENAICRYSTTSGTAYSAMTNTFTTTGGTSHSRLITGLTDGTAYNYYVRCNDTAGNVNTNDYSISFSVGSPAPPSGGEITNCSITTCYYVRQGASGTGTSWSNAYGTLPTTLQRGAVYFIADGDYTGYTFDDVVSGTQYITIKKAISTDHGTDTGWNTSYGDGQAIFSNLVFSTSYWIFDGRVGGGPSSWTSGFGFKVTNDNSGYDYFIHLRYATTTNIVISHVDIGPSTQGNPGCDCALYSVDGADNVILRYSYIHHLGDVGFTTIETSGWVFEYNRMDRLDRYGPKDGICGPLGQDNHGTGIEIYETQDFTIRYNYITNIEGTGWIGFYGGTPDGVFIYGNTFENNDGFTSTWGNGVIYTTSGGGDVSNLKIYNNNFVNLNHYAILGITHDISGNEFKNNIIYNVSGTPYYTGTTKDYNAGDEPIPGDSHLQTLTSNPFVDIANGNFRLKQATMSGLTLSSPYNEDIDGNTRGADGTWDRGAYEYV